MTSHSSVPAATPTEGARIGADITDFDGLDGDGVEHTFQFRWTTSMDIVVTTTGTDEEDAYEKAVRLASDRLQQVAVTINGVAIHGDIDGLEADEITDLGVAEA